MALEIERKFLTISNSFKKESYQKIYIKQGFLSSHKERTVRVRVTNESAFITVKGISNSSGTSRFEWEQKILQKDAEDLLILCEETIIEKNRFLIKKENHIFEVDEFLGANKGLIIAEIELKHEDEKFIKPSWLGKEVTGHIKYYNSNLSNKPFATWPK